MHNTSAESLTSAAPPACDTLQSRSPPVFCHSGHQIGRTAPSMHRPECLCHWQTVARTGRWDMETPEGQQKVSNKMWAERTCQCFLSLHKNTANKLKVQLCGTLVKCLSVVNLPWRNLEVGSSLCRGLKVPTLHSSSLWDGFVWPAACERTRRWGRARWQRLRIMTIQHHAATHCTSEGRILQSITKSLHSVLSPAMFPKAHTACR